MQALEAQIRFNGCCPYRCEPEEVVQLDADSAARHRRFDEVMRADVQRQRDLAAERLRGSGVACLVMHGNDDGEYNAGVLRRVIVTRTAEKVISHQFAAA